MNAAPKLPLDFTDGKIDCHTTDEIKEIIKQNFKMLLLTVPGERIMIPDFGVGLRQYLFELEQLVISAGLSDIIINQAKIYIPPVNILNITVYTTEEDAGLFVRISYEIDFLNAKDELEIEVEY